MAGPLRKQNSQLFLDSESVPDIDQTPQNIPPPGSCENEASLWLKRRGHEIMTEFLQLWNGVWNDLSLILNSYWSKREVQCCFLFVQTLFTIFSMAGNQAVKPENWPDKVTRHLRDIDQWPEPGAREEDSWVQYQEDKRTDWTHRRLPPWHPHWISCITDTKGKILNIIIKEWSTHHHWNSHDCLFFGAENSFA